MGQLKFGPGHGFSFLLRREIDISRRGRGGNVGPDWVGIQARWKEGEIQSLNFPRFPLVILGAQRRREYVPRHLRPLSFRFLRGSFRVLVLPGALFSPKILPPEGPGRKISGSLDLRCPFCSRLLALALFAPRPPRISMR